MDANCKPNALELKGQKKPVSKKTGRRFLSQLDMAIAKHDAAVRKAQLKRGETTVGRREAILVCSLRQRRLYAARRPEQCRRVATTSSSSEPIMSIFQNGKNTDSQRKRLYQAENKAFYPFLKTLRDVSTQEKYAARLAEIMSSKYMQRMFPAAVSAGPVELKITGALRGARAGFKGITTNPRG
jgi:hypothetical protein